MKTSSQDEWGSASVLCFRYGHHKPSMLHVLYIGLVGIMNNQCATEHYRNDTAYGT
jgi:hypothetical protein